MPAKPAKRIDEAYIAREKALSHRSAAGNELAYLKDVLESGNLSGLMGGTFTGRFEKKFAELTGSNHAVAIANCMCALHAAVVAAQAGPGCEVICDSLYVFGAMAVLYNGAIPVFVDIDPTTHNMNPDTIAAAITDRTRAVIVTHAWGLPAEMDRICAIAREHNLVVIEDCAEAVLARHKGHYTGTLGDMGCFSFQASKQMSLGDGGMATAQEERYAKALANYAGAPTFLSVAYGLDYNYRINEPTAAIGLARLEQLPAFIEQLKTNASYYDQAVADCPWLTLQRGPDECEHSFYYWVANIRDDIAGAPSLEKVKSALNAAKIGSISVGYTGIPAYGHPLIANRAANAFGDARNADCRMNYDPGTCPVAERIIPRMIMAYVIGPEHEAQRQAAALKTVIDSVS